MSENRACPKCREVGRDKKGDHLFLMEDGKTWFCNKPYHEPYFESEDSTQNFHPTNEEIFGYPIRRLPDRGISEEACKLYRVRVGLSQTNGEDVIEHYYPYVNSMTGELHGYKIRKIKGKKFFSNKSFKGIPVQFFGQQLYKVGGRKLLIVGGECDTLATWDIFKNSDIKFPPAIVGFPQGENTKPFKDNKDFIDKFEKIVLCPDQDKAGLEAMAKIANLLGPKLLIMNISEKDPNDMLRAGKEKEFINAFYTAERFKIPGIIKLSDIDEDKIIQPIKWGLSYPWDGLNRITFGAYTQRVIGIGAGPGSGKTTFMEALEKNFIFQHNEKICIFALEDNVSMAARKIIGSIMNKRIHLPDTKYSIDDAREIKNKIEDRLFLFNYDEHHNIESIFEAIRWLRDDGVRWFFIDPLSVLHAGMDSSQANTFLEKVMYKMEKIVEKTDCTIYHANHLKNPQTGKDHGAGGRVYGSQFSGSRAQWKYSTDIWGLERDQLSEDEEEKNTITFSSIKSRMSGNTSTFILKFDKITGTLIEPEIPF